MSDKMMRPYASFSGGINTIASNGNIPINQSRQLKNTQFIGMHTIAPRNGSKSLRDFVAELSLTDITFISAIPFPRNDKTVDYIVAFNDSSNTYGYLSSLDGTITYQSSGVFNEFASIKYAFHSKLGKTYIVTGNEYLELYEDGTNTLVLTPVPRYEVNAYDLQTGFNALDDDPFLIENDLNTSTIYPIGLFAYDKDPDVDSTAKILTSWVLGKQFYLKLAYGKPSAKTVEFKFEYKPVSKSDEDWVNFNQVTKRMYLYNRFYNGNFNTTYVSWIVQQLASQSILPNYDSGTSYSSFALQRITNTTTHTVRLYSSAIESIGEADVCVPLKHFKYTFSFRNPIDNSSIKLKIGHKYRLTMPMTKNTYMRYVDDGTGSLTTTSNTFFLRVKIGDSTRGVYQSFTNGTDSITIVSNPLSIFTGIQDYEFVANDTHTELILFDTASDTSNTFIKADIDVGILTLVDVTEEDKTIGTIYVMDNTYSTSLPSDPTLDYYLNDEDGAWQDTATKLVYTGQLPESGYILKASIREKYDLDSITLKELLIPQFLMYGSDKNANYNLADLTQSKGIMYYWNQIILYGEETFKNTVYISDIDAPDYFPMPKNTVELPSDMTSDVYKLLKFKNSIIVFTFKGIYMLRDGKLPEDMKFITLNPDIGMYEKDAETPRIVGNAVIFKGGDRIYALIPQVTAMDDSMINIKEIDKDIYNIIPKVGEYKQAFAVTHKNVYYLAFSYANKTIIYKYYYQQHAWLTEEYPYEIVQFIKHNLETLYCTTRDGQLVQMDLELPQLREDSDLIALEGTSDAIQLVDYYYIGGQLTKTYFNVIIETGANDLGSGFHLKKFKELQLLFSHKDYNAVDITLTVKVNSTTVYSSIPNGTIIEDENGYLVYEQNETSNIHIDNLHIYDIHLATGTLFGLWELGESPFGETQVLKHIAKYQGKGYNTSFIVTADTGDYFELIGHMYVFKLKKAK